MVNLAHVLLVVLELNAGAVSIVHEFPSKALCADALRVIVAQSADKRLTMPVGTCQPSGNGSSR